MFERNGLKRDDVSGRLLACAESLVSTCMLFQVWINLPVEEKLQSSAILFLKLQYRT
jgi:hypothetical protein